MDGASKVLQYPESKSVLVSYHWFHIFFRYNLQRELILLTNVAFWRNNLIRKISSTKCANVLKKVELLGANCSLHLACPVVDDW